MSTGFRGRLADADLRLLRVFRSVVEQGGFAGAELALGKGKSAVSMDIAHLEQRLGTRLCRRGRGGFALTEAGAAVNFAVVQLLNDLDRFGDRVAAATGRLTGRLSLMVVDNIVSIAAEPLTAAIGCFARQHPEVRLAVESAPARVVAQAVLDRAADLGVSVLPRPLPSLRTRPLFREALRLYCGRAHPLWSGKDSTSLTPAEVCAHALVRPSVMDDPAFARSVAAFAPGAEASAVDARILLVLSGAYLAFLPEPYARPWEASGAIRAVLPAHFHGENTFHLLWHSDAERSAAATRLREIMLAAFAPATGARSPAPAPAAPAPPPSGRSARVPRRR